MLQVILALLFFAPKTVAVTEIWDSEHVLIIYTDMSMAIAPIATIKPDGTFVGGTTMEVTSDELIATWKDANGIEHTVRTNCVTMKIPDCALQHSKAVDLMTKLYPVKKE